MASHQEVAERYVEQVLSGGDRFLKNHNMFVSSRYDGPGQRLWSYGYHFELARLLPSGAFLLNGDLYSNTTSKHQREIEAAVQKAGRPYALIPYSALDAAGIDKDTVKVLDSRAPHVEKIPVLIEPVRPLSEIVWGPDVVENEGEAYETRHQVGTIEGSDVWFRRWLRGYDYSSNDYVVTAPEDAEVEVYSDARHGVYEKDGDWYYDRHRHWLGASLISAVSLGRRRKFLSDFDSNERRPLYFFCELPRCAATTIEEALECLKPPEVVEAEEAGLEVVRQGDVFAVPAPEQEGELWAKPKYAEKMPLVLGTSHTVSQAFVIPGKGTFGRGILRHQPGAHRPSDHARRKMGDGRSLYRLVRNRVPLADFTSNGSIARQSGQARAWTMGGRVD